MYTIVLSKRALYNVSPVFKSYENNSYSLKVFFFQYWGCAMCLLPLKEQSSWLLCFSCFYNYLSLYSTSLNLIHLFPIVTIFDLFKQYQHYVCVLKWASIIRKYSLILVNSCLAQLFVSSTLYSSVLVTYNYFFLGYLSF